MSNDKAFCVWEGETVTQLSHDQELVKRLKRRYFWYRSHDWKEQYDGEGRLLRLSLDNLNLIHLPRVLWQFTSLQTLHLDSNHLSSLPAELGQLANLQELRLDGQVVRENAYLCKS